MVDDVLAETGAVQRRLRDLPSRVGVYFVLALGLFPGLGYARVWAMPGCGLCPGVGYARVWDKLTAGLAGMAAPSPSEKALRDL